MSRLPTAADDRSFLPIALLQNDAERTWVRISGEEYATPIYYSSDPDNRFTPQCKSAGVLYLSKTQCCALGETICRNVATKSLDHRVSHLSDLESLWVYEIRLRSALTVLDLTVPNLAGYGLDERINCERRDDLPIPYEYGPAWAAHAISLGLDGIRYRSRHSENICLAVFEGRTEVSFTRTCSVADNEMLKILDEFYNWAII